jgi:hypothetical protein
VKKISISVRLKNSEIHVNLDDKLGHLDPHQREQIQQLMTSYPSIFMDVPKKTTAACHDVIVEDAVPIRQHPYLLNPSELQCLRSEVQCMVDNDIIEPSNSDWSSPCILVPKSGDNYRLCTDF